VCSWAITAEPQSDADTMKKHIAVIILNLAIFMVRTRTTITYRKLRESTWQDFVVPVSVEFVSSQPNGFHFMI